MVSHVLSTELQTSELKKLDQKKKKHCTSSPYPPILDKKAMKTGSKNTRHMHEQSGLPYLLRTLPRPRLPRVTEKGSATGSGRKGMVQKRFGSSSQQKRVSD